MMSARGLTAMVMLVAAVLGLAVSLGTREPPGGANDVEPVHAVPESLPSPSPIVSLSELPQAELRSALADLCTENSQSLDDKEQTRYQTRAQTEALYGLKRSLTDRLAVSPSSEHLYLAALLESRSAPRIELLERAVRLNPNDPFLMWGAVQICSEEPVAAGCPLYDWEQRLLLIDGQNSESWVRVAANRYEAGEADAALESMRHAATVAETRAYWTETIEMIERGLAAGSDYAFPERAAMAFGLAASTLPDYGDYVTMCKEQSLRSVDWAYACLAYGELVENQGKTYMGVSIARSIQKLSLEVLGDLDKLTALEERQQAHRQELLDSVQDNNAVTERLMFSNPAVFSAYMAAVRTRGESGARAYLADETSRLLEEHPEWACER